MEQEKQKPHMAMSGMKPDLEATVLRALGGLGLGLGLSSSALRNKPVL